MNSVFVRNIQRRNPFQIGHVPWIAKVYGYPFNRWTSFARQALFGFPNFLFFLLYTKICPVVPRGTFKVKLESGERQIKFDARNTQFSALYLNSYAGGYEAHLAAVIDLFMPVDGVFLDIGSNWGLFSLFVGSKPGFSGQVHAFEPFASSFRDLQSSVTQAGLTDRINCHNLALSNRTGSGSMSLPDKFQSGQAMLQEGEVSGRGQIKTTTLDSFNLPLVSLIKMDVEGAEAKVISGAAQTLAQHQPMIVFESGRNFSDVGKTLDPLCQLHDLGYEFFQLAWRRSHQGNAYFLGDDDDSDPQPQETLSLIPFAFQERLVRANGNIFACHREKTDLIKALFQTCLLDDKSIKA